MSQCGFRRNMGCTDVLVRVNETIRCTLASRQYTILLFLDLQSAFDTVSHTAILYKMAKHGFKGNILKWVQEYLTKRQSQVKIFGEYSDPYSNITGVPQGAVLSPTLFNLMMSDMPINDYVKIYSYADDITLSISGENLIKIKTVMQRFINELEVWFDQWKINLNEGKTVMQLYTRRRNYTMPVLRWKNKVIKIENCHKLLGMQLDSPRLTWNSHIVFIFGL